MKSQYEACAAQHFGLWAVNAAWLQSTVSAYNAGTLPRQMMRGDGSQMPTPVAKQGQLPKEVYAAGDDPSFDPPLYSVDTSGIAFIDITGQMTKGRSSFGGVSNVRARQAVRAADSDPDAKGIMMLIDSPGGTVRGNKALGDEIARVRREGRTPIATHAEDAMHSAALWVGVQASRVTASPMTAIGSIGTVAVVEDTSQMAEKLGIKVHVISTGAMKGAGADGAEVSREYLDEIQKRVDEYNEFFLNAVKSGRGMGIDAVRALADGRDWLAAEAKDKGLIDEVMSQDDAIRSFRGMIRQRDREREQASRRRARAIKVAELT